MNEQVPMDQVYSTEEIEDMTNAVQAQGLDTAGMSEPELIAKYNSLKKHESEQK